MKVVNPGPVPVVVDDGALVPAISRADVTDGPLARQAIELGQLLEDDTPDDAETAPAVEDAPAIAAPRRRGAGA
jgi:hypothetical protein